MQPCTQRNGPAMTPARADTRSRAPVCGPRSRPASGIPPAPRRRRCSRFRYLPRQLDKFVVVHHHWRNHGVTPMTSATDFNRSPIKLGVRGTVAARMESAGAIIPGIALAGAIALVARWFHSVPVIASFSPMILAITIGILMRNVVGTPVVRRCGDCLQHAPSASGRDRSARLSGHADPACGRRCEGTAHRHRHARCHVRVHPCSQPGAARRPEAHRTDRCRHLDLRCFGGRRDQQRHRCIRRRRRLCDCLRHDLRFDRDVRLSRAPPPSAPRWRGLWPVERGIHP